MSTRFPPREMGDIDQAFVVRAAEREASSRALAASPRLTTAEWSTFSAVQALVTSYCRLTDRYTLAEVTDVTAIRGDDRTRRKKTTRALLRLRDIGAIVYEPDQGQGVVVIGLPPPSPIEQGHRP